MSALLDNVPKLRPMQTRDLDVLIDIENSIYSFPWTRGNFNDSLSAGYSCWVVECGSCLVAYGVLMLAVQEAHILNISVAKSWQRRGLGRKLLQHFISLATEYRAGLIFLEVRPSNLAAIELYKNSGFKPIAVRRNYYPSQEGREDVILMSLVL